MTLKIDSTDIDFLYINDVSQDQLFVDGVLVFDGPVPGEEVSYQLHSVFSIDRTGYVFNSFGDLIPKEFRGQFVSAIVDDTDLAFTVIIDSGTDLGQQWFHTIGILEVAKEFRAQDAVYSFNGTQCIWKWTALLAGFADNVDYTLNIVQKEPLEVVTDFQYLPGTAEDNITKGYTSNKYQNDIFGDLEPPTYKNATVGAILETSLGFYFGFEDALLPVDYWRTLEIPSLGFSVNAADGVLENIPDKGTFWRFDGTFPGIISGINYFLRLRGRQPLLYEKEFTMVAAQNVDPDPEDIDVGYGTYGQLNMGSWAPTTNIKGHQLEAFFDNGDNAFFIIFIGTTNLPQGYWHSLTIQPGNIQINSIDMLFNEVDDEAAIVPNTWTQVGGNSFLPGESYDVVMTMDSAQVPVVLSQRFDYVIEASGTNIVGFRAADQQAGVDGFGTMNTVVYRDLEIEAVVNNKSETVFAVSMAGENKLRTYWKELRIPELDFNIESKDMIFDRQSKQGRLTWYSYLQAPKFKSGVQYAMHLYS